MRFTVSRPPFSALAALVPSGRLIVATVATALVASLSLAFSTPATISVDGQRLASDVAPVTTPGGGAYLPLRAVAEAAGARTTFDASKGEIGVFRGTDAMVMHTGSTAATVERAGVHHHRVGPAEHADLALRGVERRARAGRFGDGAQREIGATAGGRHRGDVGSEPLAVDADRRRGRERKRQRGDQGGRDGGYDQSSARNERREGAKRWSAHGESHGCSPGTARR